jgi:hypothetical protein
MPANRVKYLIGIAGLAAVLVALAAVALTSGAKPGADAERQRVAIVSEGVANPSGAGEFVLTPLRPGALRRDSGTGSSVWRERVVMRKGQRVAITTGTETLKGRRGSLTVRFRVEYVDAGNGYHVGTGTWKVVRGTGQYADIAGGGRRGDVWLERGRGPWSGRAEGLLTLPS